MENSHKIENIKDLRDDLLNLYEGLRSNEIGLREAKERNNTAGKIMNSAKLQMEYNAWVKSKNTIKFLECTD